MNHQPANVSPLWFFIKTGVLCVLVVVVVMQGYAMLRHNRGAMTHASVSTVTESKAQAKTAAQERKDKQAAQEKRAIAQQKLEKQQQAQAAEKQKEMALHETPKTPLSKALMKPETYALIKDEFKRWLDAPYGKLYRGLNLDAGTLQQLRGLLADKELTLAEGYRLAAESGTPLSAESLASLRADADGPIKELLGDDAYASYKYYESTLPARNQVNALEDRLSYKSEPLTSDQYNAFVSALSALPDPNIKPDSGAWMGNYTPDMTKDSLEIAKGILTPSQFAVYQKDYDMQTLAQAIHEKYYSQNNSAPKNNTGRTKGKNKK